MPGHITDKNHLNHLDHLAIMEEESFTLTRRNKSIRKVSLPGTGELGESQPDYLIISR